MKVIALSGKLGTGKDFIYNQYIRPRGYMRWALADHFKIWAVGRNLASYKEVFVTKPPQVRHILQQTGTEEGRNVYGLNIWLDTAYAWLYHLSETWGTNKFCITDVRFPNEVEYIQDHGGKVFRIVAPQRDAGSGASEEARNHISETALDKYFGFDGLILNDPEHSSTLDTQVHQLFNDVRWGE